MKTLRTCGFPLLLLLGACSPPPVATPRTNIIAPLDCIPALDPGSDLGCVPRSWLTKQLTIAEAENQNTIVLPSKDKRPTPFGGVNKQWNSLKQAYQPGDELWFYSSPEIAGQMKTGTDGYVLLRSGKVVQRIVIMVWN